MMKAIGLIELSLLFQDYTLLKLSELPYPSRSMGDKNSF